MAPHHASGCGHRLFARRLQAVAAGAGEPCRRSAAGAAIRWELGGKGCCQRVACVLSDVQWRWQRASAGPSLCLYTSQPALRPIWAWKVAALAPFPPCCSPLVLHHRLLALLPQPSNSHSLPTAPPILPPAAALWYSTTNLQHFFRVSDAALRGALSFGGLVALYFSVRALECCAFEQKCARVSLQRKLA